MGTYLTQLNVNAHIICFMDKDKFGKVEQMCVYSYIKGALRKKLHLKKF